MPRRLNYEFTSVTQIKILKALLVIKSLIALRSPKFLYFLAFSLFSALAGVK